MRFKDLKNKVNTAIKKKKNKKKNIFSNDWRVARASPIYKDDIISNPNYYLTNRFHVAVHLSSNGSQMTSKCGKNKKVAHEAIA